MKVGIISDTHGMARPGVLEKLKGCELILHAGDIGGQNIIDTLEAIAPVKAVLGNNDWGWDGIPYLLELEIAGQKICMAHMKRDLPKDLAAYDLVITGHTHQYAESQDGKTHFLNPGSCGPRRLDRDITMALADISENGIVITRVVVPESSEGNKAKRRFFG